MKNEYRHQRIVQAYELSQFIKHTSHNCDAVIVGGDLNLRPEDLGYKMVISNGNLCDSWISQVGGFWLVFLTLHFRAGDIFYRK